MSNSKNPDWGKIKELFESGGTSNRKLAGIFGISEAAIRKRAKIESWRSSREKTERPKVSRAPKCEPSANLVPAAVSNTVKAAASVDVRELVRRGRGIILSLMAELEAIGTHIEDLEDEIWRDTSDDSSSRRRNAMMQAISLPVRTAAAKNLAAALRGLQEASTGKKAEAQERAEAAVQTNRFSPRPAPRLVSENGRKVE